MAKIVELVTQLDLDALADNQLAETRLGAVRHRLDEDGGAVENLAKIDFVNEVLRIAKPAIYRDSALRDVVTGLMRRRAA